MGADAGGGGCAPANLEVLLSGWIVLVEKTLDSPLDSKEIQPVQPKGNQS